MWIEGVCSVNDLTFTNTFHIKALISFSYIFIYNTSSQVLIHWMTTLLLNLSSYQQGWEVHYLAPIFHSCHQGVLLLTIVQMNVPCLLDLVLVWGMKLMCYMNIMYFYAMNLILVLIDMVAVFFFLFSLPSRLILSCVGVHVHVCLRVFSDKNLQVRGTGSE